MSKIAMNRQCRVKVKFGDAVENVNQVERDPAAKGIDRIVGLEHIDPENLHIRRWNTLENGTSFTRKFVPGQTLFGKRRAYQRKVAYAEFEGICSGDILTFESKDEKVLLPELLPFICQTDAFFDYAIGTSAGSLSPRTSWKALKDFEFPLPPIEDQKRITEILWAADESLEAWIATSEALETAKQQFLGLIFQKARKVTDGWKLKKLREVADLQTGLAIGRKYSNKENTVELPYLRVANVKDGYLDLREIKTIRVLLSEVERYSVRYGDVLLTEGGDFDKVGRGTVWNGKLEECLHQNHVFCVRPKKGVLLPEFLSYQTASPYGKRYFLKCAKKTSNLASINSTQVKNFPVLLAPIEEQGRSIGLLKLIEAKQAQVQEHTNYLRSLIKRCLNTIKAGEPANV
jgi:type I restriction enzyme S subunit